MTEELVSRLEAVTQRLERVARKMGGGGEDESGVPQYVTDYDNFVSTELEAVIKATNAMKFPEPVCDHFRKGFGNIQALVRKLPNSKKPKPNELMKFLTPTSETISATDTMKYRGKDFRKYGDHYKAIYEFVNSLQWVIQNPSMGQLPAKHCQAQVDACDFNLNRVLKNNKDSNTKSWLQALKAAGKKQYEIVNEYFKTGLTWNPKGSDLASAGSSESKTQEKPKPKTTSTTTSSSGSKSGGNQQGLFSQLNRGNIGAKGFGLRKVKDSQKTKNRKPNERSGKVTAPKTTKTPYKKPMRKKGPAGIANRGGRWMVENFNEGIQSVEQANLKSNVYISMCDNTVIQVPNKVKSVVIDSCIKCKVFVNEVVSTVELVNCKSVTLVIQTKAPSIAVDKCQSPKIILTRKAYVNPPDIYTSNISAMNVEVPGKTDKDDPIEMPVPEQFCTKLDPKTNKMTTDHVKHG